MDRHRPRHTSERARARDRALRRIRQVVTARIAPRAGQQVVTRRETAGARSPLRSITSGAVLASVAAAGLIGTATVAWLLAQAHGTPPAGLAQTRLDALRTGLTALVGTGGVLALLLAAHQQWLSVRTQAHHEDVADDVRHDAAERRITELYDKATEQLGAAKAPVRLAGLYALERLAQGNPEHRQTVVSLFCAYLRMPYPPSGDGGAPGGLDPGGTHPEPGTDSPEELQVRLAAQHILTAHLQPGPDPDQPPDSYWQAVDLNLAGATLVDFDLTGCRLSNAAFDRAVFIGPAMFGAAQFGGIATYSFARFTGTAKFSAARFSGTASFVKAQFRGQALFEETQFHDVTFRAAEFDDQAWFEYARFHGSAEFGGARFGRDTSYTATEFSGRAWFEYTSFGGMARFDGTVFGGDTSFARAGFSNSAVSFTRARARLDTGLTQAFPRGWTVGCASAPTQGEPGAWGALIRADPPCG